MAVFLDSSLLCFSHIKLLFLLCVFSCLIVSTVSMTFPFLKVSWCTSVPNDFIIKRNTDIYIKHYCKSQNISSAEKLSYKTHFFCLDVFLCNNKLFWLSLWGGYLEIQTAHSTVSRGDEQERSTPASSVTRLLVIEVEMQTSQHAEDLILITDVYLMVLTAASEEIGSL